MRQKKEKKKKRSFSSGFNVFVVACAVVLMKRITDHDMGSLSDWCVQGDPAVTVDCRVKDGVTPPFPPFQPILAPLPTTTSSSSLQFPWAGLEEQVNPRPALPARGQ